MGPEFKVGKSMQWYHNIFLAAQSALLMGLQVLMFLDTARLQGLHPVLEFYKVSFASERMNCSFFDFVMATTLLSKLYEGLDTVILIINGKPLLMLHIWHHATTFIAFYTGNFTGAGFWIGYMNAFIHVIMYLYYAKVPGMRALAIYLTSLQIVQLFGGVVLNTITMIWPIEMPQDGFSGGRFASGPEMVNCQFFSAINLFICFSYFFLFLAFFSRKYKMGGGSVYGLLAYPETTMVAISKIQTRFLNEGAIAYLEYQGLAVPSEDTSKSS